MTKPKWVTLLFLCANSWRCMFYLFAFIYGIVALYDVSSFANLSPFAADLSQVWGFLLYVLFFLSGVHLILYSSFVWLHNVDVVRLNAAWNNYQPFSASLSLSLISLSVFFGLTWETGHRCYSVTVFPVFAHRNLGCMTWGRCGQDSQNK